MPRWAWIVTLLGIGGTALYLRTRRPRQLTGARHARLGQSALHDFIAHPFVFGTGAGIGNGLLATARSKPMSLAANLITAAVIGISEGMLAEDSSHAIDTALMSAAGASVGMSAFTRFDPHQRALVERSSVPAPEPA